MKNILFVCSANKERSKTAEDYFSGIYPDFNFLLCGTNTGICNREGTNAISAEMIIWADIIFTMEKKHTDTVKNFKPQGTKIITLQIPDIYKYYQKELLEILKGKTELYLR